MSIFYMDADDLLRSELRAEDAADRRRYRPHWCRDCLGFTGPGSPCREDEPEELEELDEEDEQC